MVRCTRGATVTDLEFEHERAYIDAAYDHLDVSRSSASRLHDTVESRRGGTHQARFERDVIHESVQNRLQKLDIGDQSLVFGRLDFIDPEREPTDDPYYIGRVAVWDNKHNPLVVDWRAPIAEPFYRATVSDPMGLFRRRHFASRGRELLGVEDEYFGAERARTLTSSLKGEKALIANLEAGRTGRLGDIVATIQSEQDEIIRSPLPGILVVQGGPGTGKTVVALHRAAYLLYTHRFPLAGQGVLVIGPNRLFLTYIEQVLPSLGESGAELAVLGDLVPGARVQGRDRLEVSRIKGDLRMVKVLRRGLRDRRRPLREELVIGYGAQRLRLGVEASALIVKEAARRANTHNHGHRIVTDAFYRHLAGSGRNDVDPVELREQISRRIEVREALDWMWPALTPAHYLNDLFGSRALLRSAGRSALTGAEMDALYRDRQRVETVIWTADDAPLLDEAFGLIGVRKPTNRDDDQVRTYGHIVIDEAQDLSPMELRMISRRSLNGSMTVVGDIAQATSAWAAASWDDIVTHLPDKPSRRAELTVGYRLPATTMELAARLLPYAAPGLTPPESVRPGDEPPRFISVGSDRSRLGPELVAAIGEVRAEIGAGNVAVIARAEALEEISTALLSGGVEHGRSYAGALEHAVSIIAVSMVKGLEVDAAIVVDPVGILDHEPQPYRALYVALTRATKRLSLVYFDSLPAVLGVEAGAHADRG